MNINNTLDLSLASEYNLIADKNRTLLCTINCTYMSGSTEVPFSFSAYTGATLMVKNEQGTIMLTFSTTDGSLVLGADSFALNKTAAEMSIIRAGQYKYDMYISGVIPRRSFLRGKITINPNIA